MLIDWFTVAAQAINFLILVWLLKRFLYGPVLAVIDAREKRVAAQLADAAAREAQAQLQRDEFQRRNETFARERDELLRKTADEAAAERQRLLEAARADSQVLRARLTEALASERAELSRQLTRRTQAEVFALARQTLSDLAGVSLEDRMVQVFLERLQETAARQQAGSVAERWGVRRESRPRPALVRSAFELPAARRAQIEAAVRACFEPNLAVDFEVSPECVTGLELRMDGIKVAWSVTDYLSALARDAAHILDTAAEQEAPGAGRPSEQPAQPTSHPHGS